MNYLKTFFLAAVLTVSTVQAMEYPSCDSKEQAIQALAILTCIGSGVAGLRGLADFIGGATGNVPENSTPIKHMALGVVQMGIASGYLVASSYALMPCNE